jgi:hypothetical protein
VSAGAPPDTTAPRMTAVRLDPPVIVARRGPTTLRLRLDEAARITIRVERLVAGRRRGAACVAPTRALRGARRCERRVHAVTLRRSALAGRFQLLIGPREPAGPHRVAVEARDAAGNTSTRVLRLTVRPSRRR